MKKNRSKTSGPKYIILISVILTALGYLYYLYVVYYSEPHQENSEFKEAREGEKEIITEFAGDIYFENFTEKIPGSTVSFDMVAIPGGEFTMGSPPDEPYRSQDEGPVRKVQISPFYIGRLEVTWEEYNTFYYETSYKGIQDNISLIDPGEVDAITGPTPPYGAVDQGWGMGQRPAITMTWHAAETYCRWLSAKTGKTYRLPTEAEWEYAARGGTAGPYFFEGDPGKFDPDRFLNRIFGLDTSVINSYVVYRQNSEGRTQPPGTVKPNPFGLENMLGNVYEFCSDWYTADAYSMYPAGLVVVDPLGPAAGIERVMRGGSFNSAAGQARAAARNHTRHDAWQMNDPQIPKSIWWYTDSNEVGFRVVLELESLNDQ